MRRGILRNPLFAARFQAPRADSAEPRLVPASAPEPTAPPLSSERVVMPTPRSEERATTAGPRAAAPGSRPFPRVGIPAGTLVYLALVSLAALAVSASFGAGFFLLAAPAHGKAAVAERNRVEPPPAAAAPAPIADAPANASPTAAGSALSLPDDLAPMPYGDIEEAFLPASAGSVPAASTPRPAVEAAAVASNAVPPSAAPDASASADGAARDAAAPPTVHERPTHARAAWSRLHSRFARGERPAAASQSRYPRSLTPSQSERAGSFGQLLTQLTRDAKPSDGTLTPPGASAASRTGAGPSSAP